MRSAAQLTGGRYLFLTDDSGVGGEHKEPNIPCYFVTRLDHAILRMVDIEMQRRVPRAGPGQIHPHRRRPRRRRVHARVGRRGRGLLERVCTLGPRARLPDTSGWTPERGLAFASGGCEASSAGRSWGEQHESRPSTPRLWPVSTRTDRRRGGHHRALQAACMAGLHGHDLLLRGAHGREEGARTSWSAASSASRSSCCATPIIDCASRRRWASSSHELDVILAVVFAIVVFGEILPLFFNNYAFMYLTVTGVAVTATQSEPASVDGHAAIGGALSSLAASSASASSCRRRRPRSKRPSPPSKSAPQDRGSNAASLV